MLHMIKFLQKNKKAATLYSGGIRSHYLMLQSPQWQAETIPLDQEADMAIFKYLHHLAAL
jgi:hypothetical protein